MIFMSRFDIDQILTCHDNYKRQVSKNFFKPLLDSENFLSHSDI